jgi:hypothetical protein
MSEAVQRFIRSAALMGEMRIIQHPDCFEVRSEDGSVVGKFVFDDDARRRAISMRMTRKQAFQAARNFAGKRYTVEAAKP